MVLALDDNYIGVADAAERLGVSASTVWRWIDQGRLPAYRIGPRRVRVKVADVNDCIVPARPAAPRKVWMVMKTDAEVRQPMSEEEKGQMTRALDSLKEAREMLRLRYPGIEMPSPYEVINEMRMERTHQLMGEGG